MSAPLQHGLIHHDSVGPKWKSYLILVMMLEPKGTCGKQWSLKLKVTKNQVNNLNHEVLRITQRLALRSGCEITVDSLFLVSEMTYGNNNNAHLIGLSHELYKLMHAKCLFCAWYIINV